MTTNNETRDFSRAFNHVNLFRVRGTNELLAVIDRDHDRARFNAARFHPGLEFDAMEHHDTLTIPLAWLCLPKRATRALLLELSIVEVFSQEYWASRLANRRRGPEWIGLEVCRNRGMSEPKRKHRSRAEQAIIDAQEQAGIRRAIARQESAGLLDDATGAQPVSAEFRADLKTALAAIVDSAVRTETARHLARYGCRAVNGTGSAGKSAVAQSRAIAKGLASLRESLAAYAPHFPKMETATT